MNYGRLKEVIQAKVTQETKAAIDDVVERRNSNTSDLVRGWIAAGLKAETTPAPAESLATTVDGLVEGVLAGLFDLGTDTSPDFDQAMTNLGKRLEAIERGKRLAAMGRMSTPEGRRTQR